MNKSRIVYLGLKKDVVQREVSRCSKGVVSKKARKHIQWLSGCMQRISNGGVRDFSHERKWPFCSGHWKKAKRGKLGSDRTPGEASVIEKYLDEGNRRYDFIMMMIIIIEVGLLWWYYWLVARIACSNSTARSCGICHFQPRALMPPPNVYTSSRWSWSGATPVDYIIHCSREGWYSLGLL